MRRWVSIIADMIVSGFEGVMSINGVYIYSSRGKLYTMPLVSTKSNIESIVLVAAILDYFNVTLPHVNGDYDIPDSTKRSARCRPDIGKCRPRHRPDVGNYIGPISANVG